MQLVCLLLLLLCTVFDVIFGRIAVSGWPRKHVLDRGPGLPLCEGAILRGKGAARCKVLDHSALSCAKTAEPIEMSFVMWTQVGPRKRY